jgi:dihydroxyacetone kinase-like predicted kinase
VAVDTVDLSVRGLVVVAPGPGLAEIFAGEGAVVVGGGAVGSPSTRDVLAAIRATGAGRVIVLPNDPNVLRVAQTAAEEARSGGIRVGVVPTRSPVQAMAAVAVRDDARHFHDEIIAMAEAAGACRHAEVTIAAKGVMTAAGRCEPGDVLGLVDGEVAVIGSEIGAACAALLDRLLGGGGELVTLVLGADAPPDLGERITAHLREAWPSAQTQVYDGGQPHHALLIGVE